MKGKSCSEVYDEKWKWTKFWWTQKSNEIRTQERKREKEKLKWI